MKHQFCLSDRCRPEGATRNQTLKKTVSIAVLLLSVVSLKAQNTNDSLTVEKHKVVMMARVRQQSAILLRWAVTTARAWRKANTHGYVLKRHTVIRDGKIVTPPEVKDLGTIVPEPLEKWKDIVEKNDNAALMAQALYGDSFKVEGGDQLAAIVNLAEEQQQRFAWALYAADRHFETARMAGLAYIDSTVKPGEKYMYKIQSLVPTDQLFIEEGGAFVGLQDYEELPKPQDMAAVFTDGKAMLSWNHGIYNNTYNGYYVERSEDGKNFNRLNHLPLTDLNEKGNTYEKRMFYVDTIANGKTYHYRVRGITPFGELSKPSDPVSGKGKTLLAYTPRISGKHFLSDTSVVLEWEFAEEGNRHISGFELNRSDKENGTYKTVLKNIAPDKRQIQYDSLRPSNYFTLRAVGKESESRTSFPVLVQAVDSIPPKAPMGVAGAVDSTGVVRLQWKKNKEKDLLGYHIYRANRDKEEYSRITVTPVKENTYYDSIPLKNLNSKVYYTVMAMDRRSNNSKFSDPAVIKKPDVIAPAPPVFTFFKVEAEGVKLHWAESSSDDVVRYELYRRESGTDDWALLRIFPVPGEKQAVTSPFAYSDAEIKEGNRYHYTLMAVDDNGLISTPAPPVTVVVPKKTPRPAVRHFDAYIDKKKGFTELFWKPYQATDVDRLAVYKGVNTNPPTLLRYLSSDSNRITDTAVKPGNTYTYVIQVGFTDGSKSKTARLKVTF